MTAYEILDKIPSILTPIVIAVTGYFLSRSIERSKVSLQQEKEWRARWAEAFLAKAIEFTENISVIVTSLFQLDQNIKNTNISAPDKNLKEIELLNKIKTSNEILQYLSWDIENFVQFAEEYGDKIKNKQEELLDFLRKFYETRHANFDNVKIIQKEYNKLVRQTHSELLNAKQSN